MSGKAYIGTDRIKHIFLGTDKIKHIYVGTDCVFSAELEYTVVSGTAPTLSGDKSGDWELTFTGNCELEILSVPEDTIDAFGVGGGGGTYKTPDLPYKSGGGGGGYTKSIGNIPLAVGDHLIVTIGAGGAGGATGGASGSNGGATTIQVNSVTKLTANGGYGTTGGTGGNGGSGGGGNGGCVTGDQYAYTDGGNGGNGGTNGGNGADGTGGYNHKFPAYPVPASSGGTGQGYPTTAFYELGVEVGATVYAPGAGGRQGCGGYSWGSAGSRGAGDTHGAGGSADGGSGYSGIAIIRNHR